ncbi:MAG: hypothetical protein H8E44_32305 [Planctomycetes bacterium]|nr:hypothetical protein [Planctomycetota bacterium]MBL7041758.1 hypothetical protein [Pirellulaceae bacterium]
MLNEGIVVNDAAVLVKSEIINQIRRLGPTSPDELEQVVFESLTGHKREEVDWDIEDNQAGYYTWLKSFDQLIEELVQDGYILVERQGDGPERVIAPTEKLPSIDYSQLVHPRA